MSHFFYWLLFFVSGLAAIVLAKVLDERDRRLKKAAKSPTNT